MQGKNKVLRTLGTIFFIAGILVGMVMFILMNWANFEAYFYFGTTAPADKSLPTLRCPLLMTTAYADEISIRLTNDTKLDLSPQIRTEISSSDLARVETANYPLPAGETTKLSWGVNANDMVFGHLILARVFVFSAYTLPSRSSTCGTVIINLPFFSGIDIFILALAFIVVCMAAGWGLWLAGSRPFQKNEVVAARAMVFFTIAVVIGLIAGIIGLWVAGVVCMVACLLLIVVVVGYYIQKA
jgi:hypothetical protein